MPAVSSFSTWTLTGLSWDTLKLPRRAGKDVVDVTRGNGVVKDGPFTARMGPGKDTIYARSRDTGPFNGGPGVDTLVIEAKGTTQQGGKTIAADLSSDRRRAHRVRQGPDPFDREPLRLQHGRRARLRGDGRPNRLKTLGCGNVVYGMAGDDRIEGEVDKNCYDSGGLGIVANGSDGDDYLRGSISRDRLIGGPGRDKADGGDGRDVCQAERRMRCESERPV